MRSGRDLNPDVLYGTKVVPKALRAWCSKGFLRPPP